jgi:hypothetical protein
MKVNLKRNMSSSVSKYAVDNVCTDELIKQLTLFFDAQAYKSLGCKVLGIGVAKLQFIIFLRNGSLTEVTPLVVVW